MKTYTLPGSVLVFVLLCIIYSPALVFDYLYHDDILFWAKNPAPFPCSVSVLSVVCCS